MTACYFICNNHFDYFLFVIVPCEPPINIQGQAISKSDYQLEWEYNPCQTEGARLFLFYQLDNGHPSRDWSMLAIDDNSSTIIISDMSPFVPYRGYLVTSNIIGNGLMSKVFYMKTPLGRKLEKYYLICYSI